MWMVGLEAEKLFVGLLGLFEIPFTLIDQAKLII